MLSPREEGPAVWKWILGVLVALLATCAIGIGVLRSRVTVNTPLPLAMFKPDKLETQALRARVKVPEGFAIDYYVRELPRARFMRFTPAGDLLVTTDEGKVVIVERDRDKDGHGDGMRVLFEGLRRPHGMDLWNGWLYVAETYRVSRVRFDVERGVAEGALEVVVPDLPTGGGHSTRTLRFGPDGAMYVTVGSSCNVCNEQDKRRAAMLRYQPDGSGFELFATGLRNSVGFDFQPDTNDIYATDNGRDLLGDDLPPCELNRIVPGGFYGWPNAYGERVPDPDFGKGMEKEIAASIPPVLGFGAHQAPLGITFYRGSAFPESYRGNAFVALHGSWNRTRKAGYRVVSVQLDAKTGQAKETGFATGFEVDEDVMGRPVDVAEGPDGALYISDDYGGTIYRVVYGG
jgi:glucose/arabinose dehydrogenase